MGHPLDASWTMALVLSVGAARIAGFLALVPVLPRGIGGALLRTGLVVGLSLPVMAGAAAPVEAIRGDLVTLLTVLGKEVLVGGALGFVARVPLLVAETLGAIIDNLRGAFSAEQTDRSRSGEDSVLADALSKLLVAAFMQSGAFLAVLGTVYASYRFWPIESLVPPAGAVSVDEVFGLLGALATAALRFALPFLLACLVVDVTMAFVSLAVPQAETYFMAMPLKSILAVTLLSWVLLEQTGAMLDMFEPLLSRTFPRS